MAEFKLPMGDLPISQKMLDDDRELAGLRAERDFLRRHPMDPLAPIYGAAVGAIAGAIAGRFRPEAAPLQIQQKEIRLVLGVEDMIVDDGDIHPLSAAVRREVDDLLAKTEANALGAAVSLADSAAAGLTMADIAAAVDKLRATLPPWHVFWGQTDVIESPWLDAKTGGYVMDRSAVGGAGLGWMPGEARYAVLIDPDVRKAFVDAGIDDRDLGAMCVWRARNERVAKYGAEAWPLDDAGRPRTDVLKDPWPGVINTEGS